VDVEGFDWDTHNRTKCQAHGVPLAEIEALFHGPVHVFPDPAHSRQEERFHAFGKPAGRHLFVVYTLRTRGARTLIRPISARYMHHREVKHYEKAIATTEKR
jgi:uncharacterized protein